MSYVSILVIKYGIANIFCSDGWQESLRIMLSDVVGSLYMSKTILLIGFFIVRSRKFNPSSCSSSNVKFRSGEMLLYLLWISFISVRFSL